MEINYKNNDVPNGTEDKVYSVVVSLIINVAWWWSMCARNM
jgi:hypothetical protein